MHHCIKSVLGETQQFNALPAPRRKNNIAPTSVADPDNFDADPDQTSEKNRIRILLYVKICNKKFLLKNGL
jgi:hypothetical protein